MKTKILLLISIVVVVIACATQDKNKSLSILKTDVLPKQNFAIDITKDTTLKSEKGILIHYKANSIQAATSNVNIELQEALNIEDIVKAGLTTQTKDGILSSDGMFKIYTKEESKIVKPLQISIPSFSKNFKMSLFDGKEETEN